VRVKYAPALHCGAGNSGCPEWAGVIRLKKGINLPRDRRIGFLFQNYALFPHLSVAQNIAFGLQHLPKPQRDRQVNEQLAECRCRTGNPYIRCPVVSAVALARALAIQPEVLLLDEPFSALDTHLRSQMEKLVKPFPLTKASASLSLTIWKKPTGYAKSLGSFRRQNRCLRFQREHL